MRQSDPHAGKGTLVMTMEIKAGHITYPVVQPGNWGCPHPIQIKVAAPNSAMGTPQAAEVPTAWVRLAPQRDSQGTAMVAPPMPNSDEIPPMTPPAIIIA